MLACACGGILEGLAIGIFLGISALWAWIQQRGKQHKCEDHCEHNDITDDLRS